MGISQLKSRIYVLDKARLIEIGIGYGGEECFNDEPSGFPYFIFGKICFTVDNSDSLKCVDQQVLENRSFLFLTADPFNLTAFVSGCFLTLITKHVVPLNLRII